MKTKSVDIDFYNLGFGFRETKSMFVSEYKDGEWDEGQLLPLGPIEISPAACVLNYGQGIFEGMKALRTKKGEITIFRPYEHGKRLNVSAKRLLMPEYDLKKFVEDVKRLVKENEDFIPPYDSNGSLYIRPLMIGSGPVLGIKPAEEYKFIIFTSPVGPYFSNGLNSIDLEMSKKYTRASPGGTGSTKTCSNYAGTMKPAREAVSKGFSQVLYLDAEKREYINETGAANFCVIIDDKLTMPQRDGTILDGITLKSVLELAEKKLGMEIDERNISYKELFEDNCTEAFCTGNATVITPVGSVSIENNTRVFNNREPGKNTTKLYNLLTQVQRLDIKDDFGWILKV